MAVQLSQRPEMWVPFSPFFLLNATPIGNVMPRLSHNRIDSARTYIKKRRKLGELPRRSDDSGRPTRDNLGRRWRSRRGGRCLRVAAPPSGHSSTNCLLYPLLPDDLLASNDEVGWEPGILCLQPTRWRWSGDAETESRVEVLRCLHTSTLENIKPRALNTTTFFYSTWWISRINPGTRGWSASGPRKPFTHLAIGIARNFTAAYIKDGN